MSPKRSEKYFEARKSVPEELWPILDQLVEAYAFYALERHGGAYVSYGVIADLINAGWRPAQAAKQGDG